ncbi:MAG TPA: alpha/beta hydrolase [Spongiibacteraceae bacterium]|jgi:hypothetical protein
MKERSLRIGKPTPLIGVASEPENFNPDLPAVLVLNSGVMHHVGTCRLSVKIGRTIAASGLLAVRFDYSGIGDSEPRRGALSFEESSIGETREVMDYLQKTRGINQFILYGLCSGADASYVSALADERVVGIVKVDPYCYRTWQYPLRYYAPLLLDVKRWKNYLFKKLGALLGKGKQSRSPNEIAGVEEQYFEVPTYTRRFPPRDQVALGLQKLIDRNVHIYVIFTGGEPEYIYQQQYRQSFSDVNFRGLLRVDYYPQTNHIITQIEYQQRIVAEITGWVAAISQRSSAQLTQAVA